MHLLLRRLLVQRNKLWRAELFLLRWGKIQFGNLLFGSLGLYVEIPVLFIILGFERFSALRHLSNIFVNVVFG